MCTCPLKALLASSKTLPCICYPRFQGYHLQNYKREQFDCPIEREALVLIGCAEKNQQLVSSQKG